MNNRIKEIRKKARLTQTEFGAKIGVKGNTITGYENGIRTPSDAVIVSICREFRVNEGWLRTGAGEMYEATRETLIDQLCAEKGATELEREFLRAYFEIDSRIRDEFIQQLFAHFRAEDEQRRAIDAEVEAYRRELEEEARGAGRSSASPAGESDTA